MSKRYVLFFAESDLSDSDAKELARMIGERYEPVKVIPLRFDHKGVVVKTNQKTAPKLRSAEPGLVVAGKRLTPILTSGAIGKLKRRARGGVETGHGQVHE